MCHVSAQGVDEHMINVHYYYNEKALFRKTIGELAPDWHTVGVCTARQRGGKGMHYLQNDWRIAKD